MLPPVQAVVHLPRLLHVEDARRDARPLRLAAPPDQLAAPQQSELQAHLKRFAVPTNKEPEPPHPYRGMANAVERQTAAGKAQDKYAE